MFRMSFSRSSGLAGPLERLIFGIEIDFRTVTPQSSDLGVQGHNPVACMGHDGCPTSTSETGFSPFADPFRHLPGVLPNRFLKQALKSPKWLNPHCSATLMIFTSGFRSKEDAFKRRNSILREATAHPKC